MFQFIPKTPRFENDRPSLEEQLRHQTENYAVLVKKKSENEKEVKIVISSPETQFKIIDVTMTPRQQQGSNDVRAKVSLNGNDIQIDENTVYEYEKGYLKVYKFPSGEVKLQVTDQFNVIYDGERIKLNVENGKFKNAVRGICGQFNWHRSEDFLTPDNCFVQNSEKFIKSYEVEGSQGEQIREQLRSGRNMECVRKSTPLYVDAVTVSNKQSWSEVASSQCTSFQTKYVQENGEICFTIRPMPVCIRGCRSRANVEKEVAVHCIQKSSVALIWKTQIDNGGSPDFSEKSESRRVSIRIPENCA